MKYYRNNINGIIASEGEWVEYYKLKGAPLGPILETFFTEVTLFDAVQVEYFAQEQAPVLLVNVIQDFPDTLKWPTEHLIDTTHAVADGVYLFPGQKHFTKVITHR